MGRGGVRPGAGRKAINPDVKKKISIAQRYTVSEWDLINRCSEKLGLSMSEYIRGLVLEDAQKRLSTL